MAGKKGVKSAVFSGVESNVLSIVMCNKFGGEEGEDGNGIPAEAL